MKQKLRPSADGGSGPPWLSHLEQNHAYWGALGASDEPINGAKRKRGQPFAAHAFEDLRQLAYSDELFVLALNNTRGARSNRPSGDVVQRSTSTELRAAGPFRAAFGEVPCAVRPRSERREAGSFETAETRNPALSPADHTRRISARGATHMGAFHVTTRLVGAACSARSPGSVATDKRPTTPCFWRGFHKPARDRLGEPRKYCARLLAPRPRPREGSQCLLDDERLIQGLEIAALSSRSLGRSPRRVEAVFVEEFE